MCSSVDIRSTDEPERYLMVAEKSTHQRVTEGRYEAIDSVIASLSEQSHDNNGGMYAHELSDEELAQLKALEIDPFAKANLLVHHGVKWTLNRNSLKVWRHSYK